MLELTFNFRSGIFNPSFSQNEFILFTKNKKEKEEKKRKKENIKKMKEKEKR